jgi:two-component system chemotaxis response regulator CheB
MASRANGDGRRDLIGIGASAGGIEALMRLLADVPPNLPAAIAVVLHLGPRSSSALPALLARQGALPAEYATDGVQYQPGRVYVAPANLHMVVEGARLRLVRGPRQNRARPAIDSLFRSAARTRGRRFIGVILSGSLDDGSAGLVAVRRHGGVGVVQEPSDALFHEMPQNALDLAGADHCVPIAEMASLLDRLAREPVREVPMATRKPRRGEASEVERARSGETEGPDGTPPGAPSLFACPDCGGVLFEQDRGTHYACRVGHAYSPETLLHHETEKVEEALWAGLRALEESAVLSRRLERRARERVGRRSADQFAEQAEEAEVRAKVLRRLLQGTIFSVGARRPRQAARARRR